MPNKPGKHAKKNKLFSRVIKRLQSKKKHTAAPKKPSSIAMPVKSAGAAGVIKQAKRVFRKTVRLVRAVALYLYRKMAGKTDKTESGRKQRISKRRLLVYASAGMMVIVTVLVVLFVPGKAAVLPNDVLTSLNTQPNSQTLDGQAPDMGQKPVVMNAIPTTRPDIAPVYTTRPDVAPTVTPKPSETPEPKATPKSTTKPTPTPKPTTKPKATPKPTTKPTATPKPTTKPTPTPDARPDTDMNKMLDYYVVSEGPYYNEIGYYSNHYGYTDDELYMLAQIIQKEAGGESDTGKIAVGNVVINRVLNGRWGKSIDAVKDDFAYSSDTVPKQPCIDAAHAVLDDEVWKVPQNTYFFKTSGGSWRSFELWKQIGNHYFYTEDYSGRYNGDGVPAALFDRTFKYAQYGCKPENRVKRIQLMLKDLGYKVSTDKYFGLSTKEALIQFQKDAGLEADGVAGKTTVEKLINKYGVDKYIEDFL